MIICIGCKGNRVNKDAYKTSDVFLKKYMEDNKHLRIKKMNIDSFTRVKLSIFVYNNVTSSSLGSTYIE